MNETVLLILSYLPPIISTVAMAIIAKIIDKIVKGESAKQDDTRRKLNFIASKLQEANEKNKELLKEIESLKLELKGFKKHE